VEVTLTPDDKLGEESLDTEKYYSHNKAVTDKVEALTALQEPQNETKVQQKILTPAASPKSKSSQSYAARISQAPATADATPKEVLSEKSLVNENLTASASVASAEPGQNESLGFARKQVVMMRGTKASSAVSSPASQAFIIEDSVQPVNGWENYQAYISQNKRLPAPEGEATTVIVKFTIDSLGKPDTCHVEKGIDENYNAEAIRLLKEGPVWKANKTGRKNLGYIQMDFK
jgi:hypothetical protein